MKQKLLPLLLALSLLLTGCGARRDAENWKAFAETVETAERISFHAEITAHWEDSSASFGADVARAGGETHITLTAPETVSGITVRAKDGETAVEFDGVILSLDAGRSETLSPCGAPQRMLAAQAGHDGILRLVLGSLHRPGRRERNALAGRNRRAHRRGDHPRRAEDPDAGDHGLGHGVRLPCVKGAGSRQAD